MRRYLRATAILSFALAFLAGCVAEESSGPQFANNPGSTAELPTPSPPLSPTVGSQQVQLAPSTPIASPIDPETLLDARGGPSRLYFYSDAELWTIAGDGTQPRRLLAPGAGEEIRASSPSPSGDRVAVLLVEQDSNGERASAVVLDQRGQEIRRAADLETALGEGAVTARSLDWSPRGDRLLIAFAAGGLAALPADGEGNAVRLFGATEAPAPSDAAWSPTGEAVAFVGAVGTEVPARLYLASTVPTPAAPRPLVDPTQAGRTVADLAWLPDGQEILFTERAAPGRPVTGGDLWRIATDGSGRSLVASAGGTGFPAAQVANVAPSPDGDAVAYTVVVPSESGIRFHSLRLRGLADSSQSVEMRVPAGQAVTDLWWTASGLVFRTVPAESFVGRYTGGPFGLYRATLHSEPTQLYVAPSTPAGTPGGPGSPAASPEATAAPVFAATPVE